MHEFKKFNHSFLLYDNGSYYIINFEKIIQILYHKREYIKNQIQYIIKSLFKDILKTNKGDYI